DTGARRNGVRGAELQHRTRGRFVRFEIPVGRVECLPEAVEIRLAARGPRSTIALGGDDSASKHRRQHGCGERSAHFKLPLAFAVASAPSLASQNSCPSAFSYFTPAT